MVKASEITVQQSANALANRKPTQSLLDTEVDQLSLLFKQTQRCYA
jgi:hypothetical protein